MISNFNSSEQSPIKMCINHLLLNSISSANILNQIIMSPLTVTLEKKMFFNEKSEEILQQEKWITLENISHNERNINFNKPITITIKKDKNIFFIESRILNIISHGYSEEDALKDFFEDVFFVWDEFAKNGAEEMTENALEYKNLLNRLMTEK